MIASQITHFLSQPRLSSSTLNTFTMSTLKSPVLAFIWILLLSFIFILFVCILGGIVPNKSNTDLNNLKTNGFYQTYSCTNAPSNYGMTRVFTKQGDVRQVFMQVYHPDISIGITPVTYVRNYANNTWSDWAEVAINVPSFYKNYNSLDALISALGVKIETSATNIDTSTALFVVTSNMNSYWTTSGELPGVAKSTAAFIINLTYSQSFSMQLALNYDDRKLYTRAKTSSGWTAWSSLT